MCSAPRVTVGGDLTARARIRNAAMELFAQYGYTKTSVRSIADKAGVSAALIIHHFGSKEGLRAACDEYVSSSFFQDKAKLNIFRNPATAGVPVENIELFRTRINYLLRMFQDGGPQTDHLFEQLVEQSQSHIEQMCDVGLMQKPADLHTTALLLTVFGVAPLAFYERFSTSLGMDPYSVEGATKLTVPMLEILGGRLFPDTRVIEQMINSQNIGGDE